MAKDRVSVLQVINTARIGGGMGHLLSLLERAKGGRYEMTLATDGDSFLMDRARAAGVDIVTLPMMRSRMNVLPAVSLARMIRDRGIDIVHLHGTRAAFYGGLACLLSGCKRSVYTIHGFSFNKDMATSGRTFYQGIEKLLSRMHPVLISVSETDRELALRMGICAPEKIRTIHNGIDLNQFMPSRSVEEGRKRIGLPTDGLLVGTVARLVPQKGIEYFIEAAGLVAAARKDARFIVVGEGELEPRLRDQARKLGIADRIIFTGAKQQVQDYYAAMDVFALSSLWEGHPLCLIEALAMKKPSVATRTSGAPEIIRDGETGLLVPLKDGKALAQAILRLLDNPKESQRIAEKGRTGWSNQPSPCMMS